MAQGGASSATVDEEEGRGGEAPVNAGKGGRSILLLRRRRRTGLDQAGSTPELDGKGGRLDLASLRRRVTDISGGKRISLSHECPCRVPAHSHLPCPRRLPATH